MQAVFNTLAAFLLVIPGDVSQVKPQESQKIELPQEERRKKIPALPIGGEKIDHISLSRDTTGQSRDEWWRLVWMQAANDNWEIFISDGAGAGTVQLTNNDKADIHPRLNRGASQIAFASDRTGNFEIFSMDARGGTVRQLTHAGTLDTQPDWRPDGSRIVYTKYDNVDDLTGQLHQINADGSGGICLSCDLPGDAFHAMYSPDGTTIAFVYYQDAEAKQGAIWLMNEDGSNKRTLKSGLWYVSALDWSPSGTMLVVDYASGENFLNGIGTLALSTGVLNIRFTGGQSVMDSSMFNSYLLGGWATDEFTFYFTVRDYRVENNRLVVKSQYIARSGSSKAPGGDPETGPLWHKSVTYGNVLRPDVNTSDTSPPTSRISNLPAFTPATNLASSIANVPTFTLKWSDVGSGVQSIENWPSNRPPIQYRVGLNGTWLAARSFPHGPPPDAACSYDLQGYTGNAELSAVLQCSESVIGERVFLRSTTSDLSGNIEPYPTVPDHDASTIVYGSAQRVMVSDTRGNPLVPDDLGLSQAPMRIVTDTIGNGFVAYFRAVTPTQSAAPQRAGFAPLPPRGLSSNQVIYPCPPYCEVQSNFHLASNPNLIANSHFETASSGWIAVGDATISSGPNLLGGNGVATLSLVAGASAPASTTLSYAGHPPHLYTDISETLHMVWTRHNAELSTTSVHYARRPNPDGPWVTRPSTLLIGYTMPPERIGVAGDLISGGFHALYPANNIGSSVTHCYKAITDTICRAVDVLTLPGAETAVQVRMTRDISGGLHALLHSVPSNSQWYAYRPVTGSWQSPQQLGVDPTLVNMHICMSSDLAPHALLGAATNIKHTTLNAGSWSAVHSLANSGSAVFGALAALPDFDCAVDVAGNLHIAHGINGAKVLSTRQPNSVWSTSTIVPAALPRKNGPDAALAENVESDYPLALRTDVTGTLHLLSLIGGNKLRYQYRLPGDDWITQQPFFASISNGLAFKGSGFLSVSRLGVAHVVDADVSPWQSYRFEPYRSAPPLMPAMVTSVTIPESFHAPTLSFMFMHDPVKTSDCLTVMVIEGISRTDVPCTRLASASALQPWNHAWSDLSPWKGQTISISIGLNEAVAAGAIVLDEITLSEWKTPVITQVTPSVIQIQPLARLGIATTQRITVTGDNFIDTPGARIGNVTLTNLVSHTAQVLVFDVDVSALHVGTQSVTVINPGNMSTTRAAAITIRNRTFYLPVTSTE